MIFNFPSQTPEMVLTDVERVAESGANQATFYPLMISPAVKRSLKERVGTVSVQHEREYYELICDALDGRFEPGSAWTFSRVGGAMIDEYIVDYEDYVGVGSGSFSYLDGSIYVNTFSLRGYEQAIDEGRTASDAVHSFSRRERMAYRLMMDLFGLELDKRAFEASFGVTPERGLFPEVSFFRAAGAFDRDDADVFTLTPKGRYLLVAMMREFFAGVNAFRDQVRAALPEDERDLLFGDGDTCSIVPTTT
jgi:coproporphyrinogen III oxidase-like Fe-S oxidoreductase